MKLVLFSTVNGRYQEVANFELESPTKPEFDSAVQSLLDRVHVLHHPALLSCLMPEGGTCGGPTVGLGDAGELTMWAIDWLWNEIGRSSVA
ncbi:hypothetical protein EON82_03225 [bacterium]|nr:MAG: hypothetical protein EON82_03225 [bacterium]